MKLRIATYEQYFAMKENAHEDVDPYGEENWNEVNVMEKAKEIYDWLSIQLEVLLMNEDDIGYELVLPEDEPIGIELLEIKENQPGDVLLINQDFYYSIFFNDIEGYVTATYLTDDKYKSPNNYSYNIEIEGDQYKRKAFDDFKRVVESIKYHKNKPKPNKYGYF